MKWKTILGWVLMSGAGIFLTSCESNLHSKERSDRAEAMTSSEKPLTFEAPKGKAGGPDRERWTRVARSGGAEYVQAKDGMGDVVKFFGFAHATNPAIKSMADLETSLRGDATLKFTSLRASEVLGVKILRFEKENADGAEGSSRLASTLGVAPREEGSPYTTRTRGALMLKQGRDPMLITLACSRASQHGEIGSYYEDLYEEYLAAFIADHLL
jgi:hypothetical protein